MWTVDPEIYIVITVPHILASIFKWTNLHWYWRYLVNSMCVMLQTRCQILRTTTSLRNVNCGPGYIQCIYSSAYSDINIHLNVPALLLEISRQFNERCAAHSMPNTARKHQFTQCELWSGHIECIYCSAYSDFNNHLNVPALLYEISRQFNVR
jgi:hypothetical protein